MWRCGFAALDEEALARPWSWRDKALDVRFALYRTLEDAQETYARVSAARYPESRRVLALAQQPSATSAACSPACPPICSDRVSAGGRVVARETLRHILLIERRYAVQTRVCARPEGFRAGAYSRRSPADA